MAEEKPNFLKVDGAAVAQAVWGNIPHAFAGLEFPGAAEAAGMDFYTLLQAFAGAFTQVAQQLSDAAGAAVNPEGITYEDMVAIMGAAEILPPLARYLDEVVTAGQKAGLINPTDPE